MYDDANGFALSMSRKIVRKTQFMAGSSKWKVRLTASAGRAKPFLTSFLAVAAMTVHVRLAWHHLQN